MKSYPVPAQGSVSELEIKHSRFITSVQRAQDASEHQAHIQLCQQKWPGASHYCSAAVFGAPNNSQCYAMSDDGEPSGTAGRPMLNVLLNQSVGEVSVVVTRYFGGIKLGTGGLQRAYSQATVEALQATAWEEKKVRTFAQLHYDYADQKVVSHWLAQYDAITQQQAFAASIEQQVAIADDDFDKLAEVLRNATQGRVELQKN
ncbi:YigZ family protein [Pseudidiomarina sediminum]|uniref:YigZ family protein n=1 Tax=Pseudidiomarina sediminum TaxID=431675 RepID=A0A432ZAR1_9GAMM|nr:YigZ family protein [Pseudidiomarina sediminum]MBY6064217.1 YigZ family protein [Pseudidiomarina sediminum]RUO75004.1 YigZ family protein [Pseudidiomarina sediminum]